jgi:hypothetical protein
MKPKSGCYFWTTPKLCQPAKIAQRIEQYPVSDTLGQRRFEMRPAGT